MTQSIKNILFLSDLTVNMKMVFEQAGAMAVTQNAKIVILHVMEENPYNDKRVYMAFGKSLYNKLKSEKKSGAHNILIGKNVDALKIKQAMTGFFNNKDNAKLGQGDSLIKKILVAEGRSVANEIIATAQEEDCGMIVMGCKQQNLLSEVMGDKLVRKILQRSGVPVLVIPFKE